MQVCTSQVAQRSGSPQRSILTLNEETVMTFCCAGFVDGFDGGSVHVPG